MILFFFYVNILIFVFSLIVSDEPVLRDQFYNGNVKTERGAASREETGQIQYLQYSTVK